VHRRSIGAIACCSIVETKPPQQSFITIYMSRDGVSRVVSYVFGAVTLVGLAYFKHLPRPRALDFRGQMALSSVAFWIGVPSAIAIVVAGFFRRERDAQTLTVIYGVAMLFLWLVIAAGNFPVA
jgi:hypothetical protein